MASSSAKVHRLCWFTAPRASGERTTTPSAYESIIFVPAGEGKKINLGDRVEVSPATVKREEHGFIRGRVAAIWEMPATKLAMEAALEHPELAEAFLKRYAPGVLLRVHVKLDERDDSTAAGAERVTFRPRKPLPLVDVIGKRSAAQDRHDVPGRDRGRPAETDQTDPALDQEGRRD